MSDSTARASGSVSGFGLDAAQGSLFVVVHLNCDVPAYQDLVAPRVVIRTLHAAGSRAASVTIDRRR